MSRLYVHVRLAGFLWICALFAPPRVSAQFSAESAPDEVELGAEPDSEEEMDSTTESPESLPSWLGTWSLYGASLAVHREGEDRAIAIGVELSDVRVFPHQLWYGYYADLRYSQIADGIDLSAGVEAGVSVFGVDLGLYGRLGRRSAIGVRARGCISALAVVSICAGGGITQHDAFFEGSVLLKYGRRR